MSRHNLTPERERKALIPDGAFTFPIEKVHPTRWFGFLLLREFTLLAFSSALDPLRIANQLSQKTLYGWRVFSEDGLPVPSSSGVDVSANAPLDQATPDIQLLICSGNRWTDAAQGKTLSALRRHQRFGGNLGGICTGAATLARAGLLGKKRFTLHWENQPGFCETFPDLAPSRSRFEEDGGFLTCGGGSAATEMMLTVIAKDYGQEFAIVVADMCLNDPDLSGRREQRSSIAKAINSRNPKLLSAMQSMYANIEEPLSVEEIAANAGLSRRQLERHFNNLLLEPPTAIYRNIRLERARALMVETDMSVMEVATACGFNSTKQFSRHFKERYGDTPFGVRGKKVIAT